jgi:hypothetical protein
VGRGALVAGLVLATLFVVGCGGGSTSTTQQVRIVMASPDTPPVDILVNGSQVGTALGYRNFVPYISVKPGQLDVEALAVSDSAPVFQQTITVAAGAYQTLLLSGPRAKIQPVLLTDVGTTSTVTTTGQGQVRVVNVSSTLGTADTYIVNAGSSIIGIAPTVPNLGFGQVTNYETEAIGNFQVLMTAPGTPSNVELNTGPLALTQSQFLTVIALDAVGGGTTQMVLVDQ